jgi:hypothetical protein
MMSSGVLARRFAAIVLAGLAGSCGGGGGSGPPPPITVAFSTPPPASLASGTSALVAATVMNDSSNGGVNWSATCSAADCGSFNPTHTASGASSTYTAPASAPNPAAVTITAASAADAGQSVAAQVTITSTVTPALADGTYVFHLSGFDGNGPYALAGAFTVAAGKITGGEQDFSDPLAGYANSFVVANSTLSSAGGNIQVVLDTGNGAIGVAGVETLRGTPVSATRVLISEYDASAAATGSLDLQTSGAQPSGGYAFSVGGNDANGEPLAIGGVMSFSAGTLDTAGSVFDIALFNGASNSGALLAKQAFQSGSVSAPDAFGRVTITLAPAAASAVPAFVFAGYVLGPSRMELVEASEQQGDVFKGNTGGSALGQGANAGQFTASSASVLTSYAHGSGGVDANGAAVMSGAFDLQANGVLGGTLSVNDLVNIGAWNLGGTYTVDATGRVSVSVTSLTAAVGTLGSVNALTFILYLDGNGNAMVIGADAFQTTQGIAFAQGGNFSLSGPYAVSGEGLLVTSGGGVPWSAVGPLTATSGQLSGFTDYTVLSAAPQPNQVLTGTQDAAQGTLQLKGLNATDFTLTSTYAYTPVSGNRLWAIEEDSQGVSLLLMEGVSP